MTASLRSEAPFASPRLVNELDAAAMLGLSVKTLRRWRWEGRELPYVKLGGAVRYDLADIDAYIVAGRHGVQLQQAA